MQAYHLECPACGWEGMVRCKDAWRGCPRAVEGKRCQTPFPGVPPDRIGSAPFIRPMTDLEAGEMALVLEWQKVPQRTVRGSDGKNRISRPRPAHWGREEGERKEAALRVILDQEPFPAPEEVLFPIAILLPEMPRPPKPRRPSSLPALDPSSEHRENLRSTLLEMVEAIQTPPAPQSDEGYFDGLAASEPPWERGVRPP